MTRILITGISGVGKSTVTQELARRGHVSVDADTDEYSYWMAVAPDDPTSGTPVEAGRDWVWREDRMTALLDAHQHTALVVSGCAPNMARFLPRFDHVVLLSASPEMVARRLGTRTTNAYGKRPDQAARVLDLIDSVEPLLRRIADVEINTATTGLAAVADRIEALLVD